MQRSCSVIYEALSKWFCWRRARLSHRDSHSIFGVARAPLLSARSTDKLIAVFGALRPNLSVQSRKRMLNLRENHVERTRRLIT